MQRVLKLSAQYENQPYVEEFTKSCSAVFIYATYVLEGKGDENVSLGDTWNLLQDLVDPLLYNPSVFCKQMINCMRALYDYTLTTSSTPLRFEIIKHIHNIMMYREKNQDRKDVLVGEYRKSPAFARYHIFASVNVIGGNMRDGIFKFHESKGDDPIMVATSLSGDIINIHQFEDGNERICRFILAYFLMQMKYSLFPALLSSFHRHGRRHYISAVKMFERKPSMLYTMIAKSWIDYWDNFEENAKMLSEKIEELMCIPEDTQVPPGCVSKWN